MSVCIDTDQILSNGEWWYHFGRSLTIESTWKGDNMGIACNHYRCDYYDCGGMLEFSQLTVSVPKDYIEKFDVTIHFHHYL